MTRIVYKKLIGRYLVESIEERCGEGLQIDIEEPINASILIGENVFPVVSGRAFTTVELGEGEIHPKLCASVGNADLEGFVLKGGTAHRLTRWDDHFYPMLKTVNDLSERLRKAEDEILLLREAVARRIDII